MINKEELKNKIILINKNLQAKGFARYDPANIRQLPFLNNLGLKYRILRKCVGCFDIYFPKMTRKFYSVEKRIYPTAYTHVINAFLVLEELGYSNNNENWTSNYLLEDWMRNYVQEKENGIYWGYSFSPPPQPIFPKIETNKDCTLCMHFMARFGILLSLMYKKTQKQEWLSYNMRSLETTLNQHIVTYENDGCVYINYYYDAVDCTLNVNTEFAQWISMLPIENMSEKLERILTGIVKLMLREQNDDGSWYYLSKDFMKKIGVIKGSVDCHHTGTVLFNLINIINSKKLDASLESSLIESCKNGFEYYLENFFDSKTGQGKTLLSGRKAGPVQYSEAIFAFCEYIKSPWADPILLDNVVHLLELTTKQLMSLINSDGSAPSEYILGKWTNLDSIRWGNGPALEALARVLALLDYGILKNEN